MEIGNAAADAVESQESPAEGIPEDSPNFSPELELSRLINRRKAELEYIDARIAQMVLLMHERGQSPNPSTPAIKLSKNHSWFFF